MVFFRNLSLVRKIVLPVGIVLVIALSGLAWIIQARSSAAVQEIAEKELIALSGQYGNIVKNFIEITLNEGGAVAHILSNEVTSKTGMSRSQATDMLKAVVQHNELIIGCGMLWEPNAFDGDDASYAGKPPYEKDGRFSVYASSIGNGPVDVTSVSPDGDYYSEPKRRRTSYVTAPYFFEVNGKSVLMVTGCVPILANGSFLGVTTTDITLDSFGKVIADLKVYQTGFGVLLTQEGTVVTHKKNSYLNKNLFDLVQIKDARALKAAMAQGQPYMDTRVIDGREMLCYYQPVTFRGTDQSWYLLVNAPLDEVLAAATALSHLTLALCVGVLFIVLFIIVLIARATAKPIIHLAGTAQQISTGKLDTAIDDHSLGGEVGRLASAFKTMVGSLLQSLSEAEAMKNDAQEQTVKAKEASSLAQAASTEAQAKTEAMLVAADKLEKVASIVSSASTELAAQIEQSERGSSEQAARMADTATAMEEMNSTVLEVAKNAGAASDVSGRTRQKADSGAQIVKKAVSAILHVQQQSLALKEDMVALSDHAQSISRIMGVISDIADQTNLLALNAAIEAARAGEAGRGFAVVADEVRKLAEKTMTSTTDVGNAISSIQESANKSMRQMDEAVQAIAEATGFANQSGEALTEIVDMVDNTADQVRAIATASEQQSSSSEEINRSITEVNTIAGETARAMEEASRAVSDLAHQAQVLTTLIEDLKQA